MINRNFWFGPEVEGRLSGVQTVFVRFKFPDEMIIALYPHLYFTIEWCRANDAASKEWGKVREYLFQNRKAITIEVDANCLDNVPPDVFNSSHILCRTSAPVIDRLKPTDTITVDVRPYHIYCVTKQAMMHVSPENYAVDVE